jgi:hypothetical protein
MSYLFIFVAMIGINAVVYYNFGIPGVLIVNFSIVTALLILIHDRIKPFEVSKKVKDDFDAGQ